MTMRILVLHAQLGTLRGGGENFSRNLFAALAARGHEVHAFFAADWRGRYPFAMPSGIVPHPVRGYWFENFGQSALSAVARHARALARPAAAQQQEAGKMPDLVHSMRQICASR